MSMNLTYYHGAIGRSDAENILERMNTTGSFLIRNSETMVGSYTLCLWAEDGYHQYRIINEGDGYFVKAEAGVEEIKYPSLAHLIDYYQNQSSANGLAAPLRLPIPVNTTETLYDLKKSTDIKEILACYFQHKFRYERHFRFNTTFYYLVERYIESGLVSDLEDIEHDEQSLREITHFRVMIFDIMKTLYESMNDVINKLNFLNSFFGNIKEDDTFNLNIDECNPEKLMENFDSMRNLSNIMKKVESNILSNLSQRLFNSSSQQIPNGLTLNHDIPFPSAKINCITTIETNKINSVSPVKNFKIEFTNSQYHILQVQCTAFIDIITSTVKFQLQHSKNKSVFKQITLDCKTIEQVMKSQINPKRLLLRELNSVGYVYIDFVSELNREEFIHCLYGAKKCQEIVLNKPSVSLSVFVGTWNTGCSKLTENVAQWLKCQGSGNPLLSHIGSYVPHDIYAIATQNDILDLQSDNFIRTNLNNIFKQDFHLISTKSNSFPKTLKISLFCRANLEKFIKNVCSDVVNAGNKGAISISFTYQDSSVCLINCHLSSGVDNVMRREEEFQTIIQNIHMKCDRNNHADLLQKHDFVFCMGDFNMCTDKHISEAMKLLQNREVEMLLQYDEMKKYHMAKCQNSFKCFKESPILHGPTYKYFKGTKDNIETFKKKVGKSDKVHVPAWCDRVLYSARNKNSLYPLSYGIQLDQKISDHKPVFSSFLLDLPSRDYLDYNFSKSLATLRIDEILLKINHEWITKRNFRIQIEGPLLRESYISQNPNVIVESPESKIYVTGQSKLKDLLKILDFNNKIALLFLNPFNFLQLQAGLSKRDIESNNLSISILVSDIKTECIANTVIPLRYFSTSQSHSFEVHLYEHGVITGSMIIRGAINCEYTEHDDNKPPAARLIELYQNSCGHEEFKLYSRSLFDLINDRDNNEYESKKFTSLNINNEEHSAFRPIQSDNSNSIQTVRHISSISKNLQNNMSKVNGMNFSNTVRPMKTKDPYNCNKELHNLSDDSCNTSKYSCHTIFKTNISKDPVEDDSDNSKKNQQNCYEDSTLMMVNNESYSTTMIRGGVTNKKRNMDARVDLSKLEADMGIIQPPLPPRYIRKNVRPAKTRQEHSNPISMASSSGSSYNANSIGESSVASAEPSCCFVNQDSEFEDPFNEAAFRKQQNSHSRPHTSLINSKEATRTDNSSKQSTITGSTNLICPSSGQYVQAVVSSNHINEDRFIEPYASTQIINDPNPISTDRKLSYEIEYVMLQRPLDFNDWLTNLAIPQIYIDKILASNFNTLDAITKINDEDMKSLGISDPISRRKILDGVLSLLN